MLTKLYNGTIELDFDPKVHKYTLNGKKVDGVTSILKMINKPALIGWAVRTDMADLKEALLRSPKITRQDLDELIKEASNKHEEIKNVSADFGTIVHAGIEYYIKRGSYHFQDGEAEQKAITTFISWAQDNVKEFVDSERVVYSKKHKYCGTLDFTCYLKDTDGLFVGDIKTTGHIYPEYLLQTAAYALAYQEEMGTSVVGRVIVRLKEGEIETKITRDRKEDEAAFKAVLKVSRRLNKLSLESFKK